MTNANNRMQLTILFADIAGSTRLYDKLGDEKAHQQVVQCLNHMGALVKSNHGRVIETIGDEIMCSFENANHAIEAASTIQEAMKNQVVNAMGVRIGIHSGLTGMQDNHPFGDVVNVAARMVGLARAGQIITTDDTKRQLRGKSSSDVRPFDRVMVKGKPQPLVTYEIIWDHSDNTTLFLGSAVSQKKVQTPKISLIVSYHSFEEVISATTNPLTIGRSAQNDLVVISNNASRNHASIEFRSGHIVYTDHSTNGSYLRTEPGKRTCDGLDFFLHRDEWATGGTGVISLGEPIDEHNPHLIHFTSLRR